MPEIDADLMEALRSAPWPNNLRQLSATIHRLLIEAQGSPMLTLAHCEDELSYLRRISVPTSDMSVDRINAAIESAGSISAAARLLGVDRTTIHRRLRRASADGPLGAGASSEHLAL